MQDGHTRAKSELHRTEEMLTSSLSGVATLEQSLASASEKYLYMQELRSYVSILCDFLQVRQSVLFRRAPSMYIFLVGIVEITRATDLLMTLPIVE